MDLPSSYRFEILNLHFVFSTHTAIEWLMGNYYGQPLESVNPTHNPTPGPSMSPEYSRQSVVSVNPTHNPNPESSMSQDYAKKKKRREKLFEFYLRSNYPGRPD